MESSRVTALTAPPVVRRPPPWLVGLRAARANLVPGVGVQLLMVGVVFAYYRVPCARPWFDRLGQLKREGGLVFSAVSTALAGGIAPELFRVCAVQRRLPARGDLGDFLFAAGFWAVMGMVVDLLYHGQTALFGAGTTAAVLCKKVLLDQFGYNPVFAAPVTVVCFGWRNGGYRLAAFEEVLSAQFYPERVFPTLLATWAVWIPLVTVIYSLPPPLQVPLFSLALCFWALMLAYLHAKPPGGS